MNKNLRKGRVPRRNDSPNRSAFKNKGASDIEGVRSPYRPRTKDKTFANRCCFVVPDRRDFGQTYETDVVKLNLGQITQQTDQDQTTLQEQNGFHPILDETITQLKGLKKVLCRNSNKVVKTTSSHFLNQRSGTSPGYVESPDGSQWQNVDNIEDIEKLILNDDTPIIYERLPKHIFISEVPRVKIIAEKFSKYKRHNLELRRLDEKVVCVEYDIFDEAVNEKVAKPVQRMRAFFSIKPVFDNDSRENQDAGSLSRLPSNIKHKFDIMDEDLKKLTDKEIEIIDGKIEENKSYLEDLRRILKRKQVINAKKNKTSLDLQSLYDMAKRDGSHLGYEFSDTNFLSKGELQEVKDLILQRCTSSVHGIRRRRIKRMEKESAMDVGVISESIVAELLREDAKLNVYE